MTPTTSPYQLIVIGGPTASGKTSLAIEVAKHFGTEVVSADSRQLYAELNIGVARPSAAELSMVPHHFIASHSIQAPLSAGAYEMEALAVVETLFQQHQQVVVCGGSGLFIKALTEGFDALPTDPGLKRDLQNQFDSAGLAWLQQEVKSKDPTYYRQADIQNPRRLLRALEVITLSGQPYSSLRSATAKPRPFQVAAFHLHPARPLLYNRINKRVLEMMEAGLETEVRSLLPYRHLSALQTVGYTELFDYFDGKCSLSVAVERIQQHTRHYAKRQLTWFRNEANAVALNPEAEPLPVILQIMGQNTQ